MMKKWMAVLLSAVLVLSLAGCNKSSGKKDAPPANEIVQTIVDKIGEDNLPGMMEGNDEILTSFYGINSADLDSYGLRMASINVRADEFFVAKVKSGKMDAVKEGIEKRKADLDNTWKQYLPDVYEIVKDSRVVENGDYILFVVSEQADTAETEFNSLTK